MCLHDYAKTFPEKNCMMCFLEKFAKMTYAEIIILYKEQKEKREFDPDKVYNQTVKFYMDKKNYTKDQANEIAQKVVEQQMEKHKK